MSVITKLSTRINRWTVRLIGDQVITLKIQCPLLIGPPNGVTGEELHAIDLVPPLSLGCFAGGARGIFLHEEIIIMSILIAPNDIA